MTDPPDWTDILDEPFVAVVLGRRGSGKTALGHRLLEEFGHGDDRDAFIINFPRGQKDELPDWITWLPATISFEDWPDGSVTLVNEAHHLAHARESMGAENLALDRLVTVSRQRDADIIFDTQYARRLDITGVMGANALIFRYPSLMADDFERSQMRSLVREARDALDEFVDVVETDEYVLRDETDELLKRAYVIGEKFRGLYPHEIEMPSHWSEDISKAYGVGDSTSDMADIEDVGEKSTEEVVDELGEFVEIEEDDSEDDGEVGTDAAPSGQDFIEEMIESGNRVTPNRFSDPIVELIVPKDMQDEVGELIEEWNIEPGMRDVVAQAPSFAENRPGVAEQLVAWQFLLTDAEDLDSAGYILSSILAELEDEPVLATVSRTVETGVF